MVNLVFQPVRNQQMGDLTGLITRAYSQFTIAAYRRQSPLVPLGASPDFYSCERFKHHPSISVILIDVKIRQILTNEFQVFRLVNQF